MRNNHTAGQQEHRDFFISYTNTDRQWAEWIALQLEDAGYTLFIQAWDFRPGSNFVAEMDWAAQTTERTILVLSPNYLQSDYTFAEWAARFRRDPRGTYGLLLPIRIQPCNVEGLLGPIEYIDLVGCDEQAARERLLAGVPRGRVKPASIPFPVSQQEGTERPAFPTPLPTIWNIPFPRNPVFTGREKILTQLADALKAGQSAALSQPQAISGLGGIGKTQSAVEYAYRYSHDYQAVLWVRAETRQLLISDFVVVAELLNLPEKDAQDQNEAVDAVKRWLKEHKDWLLIFDNADDLAMVREFVPPVGGGHLLLTTRAHAMGRLAHRIELEQMEPEEGSLFLLRRAGIIEESDILDNASEAERNKAKEISQEMDGLPLALDQAGAYIEETSCGLADYLDLYQKRGAALLKRRGGLVADHPEPVATTWSLSFVRVEEKNPAAAELLRLCAYLAPDAIAEEILTQGAEYLGLVLGPVVSDAFLLGQAIEALRAYSLVGRDPGMQMLSVHRLVQAVVRDALDASDRQRWVERAIRAVHAALPPVEHANWSAWERLLAHAQACAAWMEPQEIHLQEAARLLQQTGWYLTKRARYSEAEPLLERAYQMSTQEQGAEHLDTARAASTLAELYYAKGKYEQAEPLSVRTLAIYEQQLGPEHPYTATSLSSLAELYRAQGKYEQAEPLSVRALAIYEQQLGPLHPGTATSLNNLAGLYQTQGKYEQAEPLYVRALAIREQQLGPEHPDTAGSLNNLAGLYRAQGKYEQAEPLYVRALATSEQQLGPEHPLTAGSLNNLALLYQTQGKYEQAEPLYVRALAISEQQLGPEHPDTAQSLNNLALLYCAQGKYEQAEPLYVRALAIREQQLGPEHPDTAQSLNNLALLYQTQGKYEQVEPLLVRALAIKEQQLGPEHPDTANSLNNMAALYYAQGKYEQAEPLLVRALAIYEQQLGPEHPDTAQSLNNLALLYCAQGKYEQAEPLYVRALAIYEQQLWPEHPGTANSLNNLAGLYQTQGKYEQAEPLFERALAICELQLGPLHPHTQIIRRNYVALLRTMGREAEAVALETKRVPPS
jgi:tetratricopeptide (TPR) repeat protein